MSGAARGPAPVGLGRYAQAPWLPRTPFVPTRPVAYTWCEVLRICLGVFVGRGKKKVRGQWRHVVAIANRRLRRTHSFSPAPRGATCSLRFGSVLTAEALFRSACAAYKIWLWIFVVSSSAVSTGDKFSAKWLLETVA